MITLNTEKLTLAINTLAIKTPCSEKRIHFTILALFIGKLKFKRKTVTYLLFTACGNIRKWPN